MNYHLVAFTSENYLKRNVAKLSEEFDFKYKIYDSVAQLDEIKESANFVLLVVDKSEKKESFSGLVQSVKFYYPQAFLLIAVPKSLDEETCLFLKKSGASSIILSEELESTSKFEYLAIEVIKSTFLPIKPQELIADVPLTFTLFHQLSFQGKFIKLAGTGDVLDKERLLRYQKTPELYFHRDQVDLISKYFKENEHRQQSSLLIRSRVQYLRLRSRFMDLILSITDQSGYVSFENGKRKLDECMNVCQDLLTSLTAVENPWDVVDNSVVGCFGSVDRTPAHVALVGMVALNSNLENLNNLLLATLLSDIGLLGIPFEVNQKIRNQKIKEMNQEERRYYHLHPQIGLNMILSKKLPLDEDIKQIIMCSHETMDQKGFPNQIFFEKIPVESQILQIVQLLDSKTVVRSKEVKKNFKEEKEKLEKEGLDLAFMPSVINMLRRSS